MKRGPGCQKREMEAALNTGPLVSLGDPRCPGRPMWSAWAARGRPQSLTQTGLSGLWGGLSCRALHTPLPACSPPGLGPALNTCLPALGGRVGSLAPQPARRPHSVIPPSILRLGGRGVSASCSWWDLGHLQAHGWAVQQGQGRQDLGLPPSPVPPWGAQLSHLQATAPRRA